MSSIEGADMHSSTVSIEMWGMKYVRHEICEEWNMWGMKYVKWNEICEEEY